MGRKRKRITTSTTTTKNKIKHGVRRALSRKEHFCSGELLRQLPNTSHMMNTMNKREKRTQTHTKYQNRIHLKITPKKSNCILIVYASREVHKYTFYVNNTKHSMQHGVFHTQHSTA